MIHEGGILKRTGSMVIEVLREALKTTEEWKTSLCAAIDLTRTREEEFLSEIDARKKNEILLLKVCSDLIKKNAAHVKRETLLHDVHGKLFDKIAAQNEREALLLQDNENLLHEIDVRKKMKTLLIQERKELLKTISGLKERERLGLEGYKELALNATNSRRKLKALIFQARKALLNKIDAQKNTAKVLLQERAEFINCFSKRFHAQKKRESQVLQERKKDKVKLRKALEKLRYHRDWVRDRNCIEAMKISCREGLTDKILGRKEHQPQMEHNILTAVELTDSEKKKVRQNQNNPQRLETSPSLSPQETEVCRKRKKTQRIGTSPPPPSERMKLPRLRRKPQRYRTSP